MSLLQKLREKRFKRLARKLAEVGAKIQTENTQQPLQQETYNISFHADEEGFLYLDDMPKISEKINDMLDNIDMYIDTTKLAPGLVIYTITQQKPTEQRPWTVYKYEPRVITSIHDSGVNGGTVFFTYSHQFVNHLSFYGKKNKDDFKVVSNEESIYSPLTREHAQLICAELNTQSRSLYLSHLAKVNGKNK